MNRRNFFGNLAKAVACFTILPSVTTYARQWVALDSSVVVPVNEIWTADNFTQFLIAETPRFEAMVFKEYHLSTWLKV